MGGCSSGSRRALRESPPPEYHSSRTRAPEVGCCRRKKRRNSLRVSCPPCRASFLTSMAFKRGLGCCPFRAGGIFDANTQGGVCFACLPWAVGCSPVGACPINRPVSKMERLICWEKLERPRPRPDPSGRQSWPFGWPENPRSSGTVRSRRPSIRRGAPA